MSTRFRLLHFRGGVERYVHVLAHAFRARGDQVTTIMYNVAVALAAVGSL